MLLLDTELNCTLGGGLVQGPVVSLPASRALANPTLFLQCAMAQWKGAKTLYVSGEESAHQIKMRAVKNRYKK